MNIIIIGGGYVGQLVQLAIPSARILDWRPTAPANHLETRVGPQYLWQPIPGVPNRQFKVKTLIDGEIPTPATILRYKHKIGKVRDRGNWGLQFQHEMDGYEADLPVPRVEYGMRVDRINLSAKALSVNGEVIEYDELISTIPLPALIRMLSIGPPLSEAFRSDPIYMSYQVTDNFVDGMMLNYNSIAWDPVYRVTWHANIMFQESLMPMFRARKIIPGKIHHHKEVPDALEFLREHHCHCFGRFARWAPDELAHESWNAIMKWRDEYVNQGSVPASENVQPTDLGSSDTTVGGAVEAVVSGDERRDHGVLEDVSVQGAPADTSQTQPSE
jgi:hypothetical protein